MGTIPVFSFPESAARALAASVHSGHWHRRPVGRKAMFNDLRLSDARSIVERVEGDAWLSSVDATELLRCYGIRTIQSIVARTADEAAAAFERFDGPVAVKLVSGAILHKTDVGGVQLGISSSEAAAAAFNRIRASLEERGLADKMEGVVVQQLLTDGVECLVGVVNDRQFGPLIGFGLGGVLAEVLGDVRFRLTPLSVEDANELIAESRAARVLAGFRGAPEADIDAVRDVLLRLSYLVDEVPELAELDINPLLVLQRGRGAFALDTRIRIVRS
jgi:acyl-CoA synthetase (NDP forming)